MNVRPPLDLRIRWRSIAWRDGERVCVVSEDVFREKCGKIKPEKVDEAVRMWTEVTNGIL